MILCIENVTKEAWQLRPLAGAEHAFLRDPCFVLTQYTTKLVTGQP
jgi:hypothetical protein